MEHNIPCTFIPKDFIETSISSMANPYQNGKHNIMYNLLKCLASGDDGECRLPLNRMPYGLLSNNIMFFASENASNLKVEDHYSEWLSTMSTHFGHKWAALYNGPMWSTKDGCAYESQNEYSTEIPEEPSCSIIKQVFTETVGNFDSFSPNDGLPDTSDNSIQLKNGISVESDCASSLTSSECDVIDDERSWISIQDNSNYVSTLWSGLSSEDGEDLSMSGLTSSDLANMFELSASSCAIVRQVDKDPMKVSYLYYVNHVMQKSLP